MNKKSQNYLSAKARKAAKSYALQYPEWVEEAKHKPPRDPRQAIRYDTLKVQTSTDGDPTSENAIMEVDGRTAQAKIDTLESTIRSVCPRIYWYMLRSVGYGDSFSVLKAQGLPYEQAQFCRLRREFYYRYSKKI